MNPLRPSSLRDALPAGDVAAARPAGASRASLDARLARLLLRTLGDPPVRVDLWTGESIRGAGSPSLAQVRIGSRGALLRLLADPEFQFGECLCDGTIVVEGDLVGLLEILIRTLSDAAPAAPLLRRALAWIRRGHRNTAEGSRSNIARHYDLGNAFYRLWLDRGMSYTCAYFASPDATLEQAQVAKMDLVCRKLRLVPGERVVEAGCGWGALALHMARACGVTVTACNISREQLAYARGRARALGLERCVHFVEQDYRELRGEYDAFVSVGMLEHVGREHFPLLGEVIDRLLAPDGRGLIHSIGRLRPDPLNAWIERRIFPGAYPPSLREMLEVLEPHRFSVLDVENLRMHYGLTLAHWLRRLDAARERVRMQYDERFVRAWRLYLCGSQAAFRSGEMQLFQVLFARGRSNRVPWTRAHLFAPTSG